MAEIGNRIRWCVDKKYWLIKVNPEHKSPSVSKFGYEYEHRYLVEKHLNRYLFKDECVRHKNGDSLDNRIENLEVIPCGDTSKINVKKAQLKVKKKGKATRKKRANTYFKDAEGQSQKWDKDGKKHTRQGASLDLYKSKMTPKGQDAISESMKGKRVGTSYNRRVTTTERFRYIYFRDGNKIDVKKEAEKERRTVSSIINRCIRETMGYSRQRKII